MELAARPHRNLHSLAATDRHISTGWISPLLELDVCLYGRIVIHSVNFESE